MIVLKNKRTKNETFTKKKKKKIKLHSSDGRESDVLRGGGSDFGPSEACRQSRRAPGSGPDRPRGWPRAAGSRRRHRACIAHMDTYGHLRTPTDTYGHLWTHMDTYTHRYAHIQTYTRICTHIHTYTRTYTYTLYTQGSYYPDKQLQPVSKSRIWKNGPSPWDV